MTETPPPRDHAQPTPGETSPEASGGATAGDTVEIRLNGEDYPVPEGFTVLDLLDRLDRHPRTVAVEYNGDILPREQYGETELQAGDRVEVVHFVQGG